MRYKKSQISLEFMLLIGFLLLVFVTFLAIIQYRMVEAIKEKELELLQEVANFARNEINLAATVEDGYYRLFTLPNSVSGKQYTIELTQYNEFLGLDLSFKNDNRKIFVNVPSVELLVDVKTDPIKINPGTNIIMKQEGKVIINP